MIIQLLIVLAALYVGSRYGSLALGAISGIGLAILVFGFGLKPGTPPTDVIYIIIAAVTCAGTLQASGGMDWMIQMQYSRLRNILINSNLSATARRGAPAAKKPCTRCRRVIKAPAGARPGRVFAARQIRKGGKAAGY